MYRPQAIQQFNRALKAGQKYYNNSLMNGSYPYPQVLNEILDERLAAAKINIGLVDIPADRIVGTTTAGRKSAFAGNFMPLLDSETEFGIKWINLCEHHLGPQGITEPIICLEYLGRFYVTEGNKRVSVLKSYDAVTIPGKVTRVIPAYSDDLTVQIYYEFMQFYKLSRIYDVSFRRLGGYAKLQKLLGYEPGYVWTEDERRSFLHCFRIFAEAFQRMNVEGLPLEAGDALNVWLQVYPLSDLELPQAEVAKRMNAIWPDVRLLGEDQPIEVSTEPVAETRQNWLQSLGFGRINHLNAAFIHAFDPSQSTWSAAHEQGRLHLDEVMGDRVSTCAYTTSVDYAPNIMEQAIADGAQVIFATTPTLIDACRQTAARHPEVRVLNCSLSQPYAGVRTYYSRIYEGNFITGAIAGAMTRDDRIGYIANYPIIGVPACINAFALGARLTNPRARIQLEWSCLPGNHASQLLEQGFTVISNRDANSSPDASPHADWEWGTYMVQRHGNLLPLATTVWNWGKFYEQVLESIFSGTWDAANPSEVDKAVNYWWGMNSGVIDVQLCEDLPNGVRQLADILRTGMARGTVDPFHTRLVDQAGQLRGDGSQRLSPEEIMGMDWLCDSVEGSLPAFEDILPRSRDLVRVLGVHRDQISLEQEGTKA